MKITLDTNVLVSAFISKKGNPAKILNLIADIDGIQLILSEEILDEFKDVLSRKKIKEVFGWKQKDIDDIVKTVRDAAVIVKVKSDFKTVNEDSNDDMVLNTAYDGKCDYIVSGDKHLKNLKIFKGIKILPPKNMIDEIVEKFKEFIIPIDRIEIVKGTIIIKGGKTEF